ncbi:helix-turn-helix domain-containing protein [Patescibacteria group bacterium]|nr:helix-turn-helix domain-containing protein [Patescibacteria group bacterium]
MAKFTLEQLSILLKKRRGNRGLREIAKELGVSHTTLSRIESGKQPDLETFSKLCKWLEIDPGEMLGHSNPLSNVDNGSTSLLVQFRAKKNWSVATGQYLGEVILAARNALQSEIENDLS